MFYIIIFKVKNASSIGETAADELDDDQALQNDDKFMQLMTKHYNDPLALEMDDIYDMPHYPVAKHQQEQNIIEQMQKLVTAYYLTLKD